MYLGILTLMEQDRVEYEHVYTKSDSIRGSNKKISAPHSFWQECLLSKMPWSKSIQIREKIFLSNMQDSLLFAFSYLAERHEIVISEVLDDLMVLDYSDTH